MKRAVRQKPEIMSNTALRGIGAMIVMVYHLGEIKISPGHVERFLDLGANVNLVLDMFFLLSGFIMAYIYADTFRESILPKSVGRFLWFRVARVYPVHIFALLAYLAERGAYIFLYSQVGNPLHVPVPPEIFYTSPDLQNTPFTLLANVFIIHGVGVTSQYSWNYPSWTVSAEFAAYLTFPFLCLLIGRMGKIGTVLLLAVSLGAYLALNAWYGDLNVPGYDGVIRCIPGFAIGVAVYNLSSRVKDFSDMHLHILQTLSLAALALAYAYSENQVIVMVTLAIFIWTTSENRGWVSTALSWSPLRYLGLLSYSIYMTHIIVGKPVFPILDTLGARIGLVDAWWWQYFTLSVAMGLTILVSAFVFRYVELPSRFALDKLVKRPANVAPSPLVPTTPGSVGLVPEVPQAGAPSDRTRA